MVWRSHSHSHGSPLMSPSQGHSLDPTNRSMFGQNRVSRLTFVSSEAHWLCWAVGCMHLWDVKVGCSQPSC